MSMGLGLVGRKCGMTRVFNQEDGSSTPVTVIEVVPHEVVQVKTADKDGYSAIKVAYGNSVKADRLTKPLQGEYKKADVEAREGLKEFRFDAETEYKVGDKFSVETFEGQKFVDVQGTSKGKGFAGAVKRHNFRTQDATHGNSLAHRAPGSIGQNQTPGRVWKGKKMAGHMGNKCCTMQSLELVKVDTDRNLLLVKGSVPGADSTMVMVKPSVKKKAGDKK